MTAPVSQFGVLKKYRQETADAKQIGRATNAYWDSEKGANMIT